MLETPVLESLFKKVAYRRPVTLLKKTPTRVISSKCCKTFQNTYFAEHMRRALSVYGYFYATIFIQTGDGFHVAYSF